MKRGNNVFKVSGNLALGGGSDYLSENNLNSLGNISAQKRTRDSKGYQNGNQKSYQQKQYYQEKKGFNPVNNYGYENVDKRKASSSIRQNIYNKNEEYDNLYNKNSQKRGNQNYQSTLENISRDKQYPSKAYKIDNDEQYQPKNYGKGIGRSSNNNQFNNEPSNQNIYSNTRTTSSIAQQQKRLPQKSKYDQYDYQDKYSKGTNVQQNQYEYNKHINQRQNSISTNSRTQQQKQPLKKQVPAKSTSKINSKPLKQEFVPSNYQANYEQDDMEIKKGNKIEIQEYDPSTFVQCRKGCGRKFNPDSLLKHQKICKKVFQNKRKQFNTQQQRIVEQQQKKLIKKGAIIQKKIEQKKQIQSKKTNNVPKWKAQSLGFRAILKANRRGGEMTQEEKKIVKQAEQSNMIKCKFCGRKFNEQAGTRHIKFCEQQQKKNAMKKPRK